VSVLYQAIVPRAIPEARLPSSSISHVFQMKGSVMRALACVLTVLMMVSVVGCDEPMTNSECVRLLDHTKEYQGKTIKMKVMYDGGGSRQGDRLFLMPVQVYYDAGHFDLRLDIPQGVDQPNIHPGDRLIVTFVCEKGLLDEGNKVTKIGRP
jgi:hypothetical protein